MSTLTKPQFEVLSRYSGGMDLTKIAKATALDLDLVSHIVTNVAGMNRQRAAQLVREYETARRNEILAAAPTPAPAGKVDVKVEPKPQPEPPIETIEDLLNAAEKSTTPKMATLAARIRAQVTDLQALVQKQAQEKELWAEADRLRARLDEIHAQLRPSSTRKTTGATADGPDPKTVRTWAARNGVECPAAGRVPKTVNDAYLAAQKAPEVATA